MNNLSNMLTNAGQTTLHNDELPETREAIERWRQGKINIWDDMARLEKERDALEIKISELQKELDEQCRLLGISAEREVSLLGKLEMQKKDILSLNKALETIREGYEGTCYACETVGELNQSYREHVRELIRLLEIEEESDSGRPFKPNYVSSCRVMDGMKINQCLKTLRNLAFEDGRSFPDLE